MFCNMILFFLKCIIYINSLHKLNNNIFYNIMLKSTNAILRSMLDTIGYWKCIKLL